MNNLNITSKNLTEIITRLSISIEGNVPVFRVFPISFGSREQFPGSTSRLEMLFLFNRTGGKGGAITHGIRPEGCERADDADLTRG